MGRTRSASSSNLAQPLIDWHEPESNAHVLDWRQRAREFGVPSVDESAAADEHLLAPVEELIGDEPEAAEEHAFDSAESDELSAEELEEPLDARVPQDDPDLVGRYLRQIG